MGKRRSRKHKALKYWAGGIVLLAIIVGVAFYAYGTQQTFSVTKQVAYPNFAETVSQSTDGVTFKATWLNQRPDLRLWETPEAQTKTLTITNARFPSNPISSKYSQENIPSYIADLELNT